MSQKEFAQFTGISEGSLSGVFNGRTRPSLQMVESIHEHLSNVSVEWILFGTGPMYIDNSASSDSSDDVQTIDSSDQSVVQPEALSPSLFGNQEPTMAQQPSSSVRNVEKTVVKYIDKPERKITEIRIFYDDQTWETFEPKR